MLIYQRNTQRESIYLFCIIFNVKFITIATLLKKTINYIGNRHIIEFL